jgi:predicted nucleic acid-binding protein
LAPVVLLDAGPLVALLDKTQKEHARVKNLVDGLPAPFLTVEPVLSEACFLLRHIQGGASTVLRLVQSRVLRVALSLNDEAGAVERLLGKYADVPMSLADACLVRLSEQQPRSVVLTFDSDFRVYRRHGRQRIPLLG